MNKYRISKRDGVDYTGVGDIYADSSRDALHRLLNNIWLTQIRKDNSHGEKLIAQEPCDILVHRIDPISEEVLDTSYYYDKWKLSLRYEPYKKRQFTPEELTEIETHILDKIGWGFSFTRGSKKNIVTVIAQVDVTVSEMYWIEPRLAKKMGRSWYCPDLDVTEEEQRQIYMDLRVPKGDPVKIDLSMRPKFLKAKRFVGGKSLPLFIREEDTLTNE